MTDETITSRLHRLQTHDKRALASRFRENYPAIEAALQAGNTRQAVLQELRAAGLSITFNVFKKYLQESRIKHRNSSNLSTTTAESKPTHPPIDAAPSSTTSRSSTSTNITPKTATPTAPTPQPESNLEPAFLKPNPYDPSDPRSLDFIRKNPPNLAALEAAGKALLKASKK